jgi:hypothetical protein
MGVKEVKEVSRQGDGALPRRRRRRRSMVLT